MKLRLLLPLVIDQVPESVFTEPDQEVAPAVATPAVQARAARIRTKYAGRFILLPLGRDIIRGVAL